MKNIIKETVETTNLIIENAKKEECEELTRISNTWDNKKIVEGEDFEPDYIYKCLTEGDLPPIPNAKKDKYRLKSVYSKESKSLVGFFDLYHGYPNSDSIWISIFIIDKENRKSGYGKEVIEYICKEAKMKNYKKICVGVQLKNWSALRFWTKSGFDKIMGIYGDKMYSENNFAVIGLENIL